MPVQLLDLADSLVLLALPGTEVSEAASAVAHETAAPGVLTLPACLESYRLSGPLGPVEQEGTVADSFLNS
jgi:hypothetical protein